MKYLRKLYPPWLKKALYEIREFFWPLLDSEPASQEAAQRKVNLHIEDENLELAFELQKKISDSENDRRAAIESKASLFISTISVSTSVVVGANTLIVGNSEFNSAVKVFVFISFILTIYTVRTVWYSVRALERKGYHMLDIRDINIKGNNHAYRRALILKMDEHTRNNYAVINEKVDNFILAKAYFERAIVVISIYAIAILIYCFFFKQNKTETQDAKPKFVTTYLENSLVGRT